MKEGIALTEAVANLSLRPYTAICARLVRRKLLDDGAPLLSAIGSWFRGGRFNPRRAFEVLYFADDPLTATQEVLPYLGKLPNVPHAPYVLLAIRVSLSHLVDLRDVLVQRALDTDESELTLNWRIALTRSEEPLTHRLGQAIYSRAEVQGFLCPSAQRPGSTCVDLIPEIGRFHPGDVIEVAGDPPDGPPLWRLAVTGDAA